MSNKNIVDCDGNQYSVDELITVNMAMQVFNVSRITVYNWLGKRIDYKYPNGKFPNSFKTVDNGKIYIPIKDVENLISKLKNFPKF